MSRLNVRGNDIDSAVRKLSVLRSGTYRRDFREAANEAIRVIEGLVHTVGREKLALRVTAMRIEDLAERRPQLVFRTKKCGALRWVGVDTREAVKVAPEQIVGTYDRGADWRQILADLEVT